MSDSSIIVSLMVLVTQTAHCDASSFIVTSHQRWHGTGCQYRTQCCYFL